VADFSELRVWQIAHALSVQAYRVTAKFPRSEQFGLTTQVRRAAVSIAANIAEGSGRYSSLEQARFLEFAKGSAKEVRSHLMIARDLGYLAPETQGSMDGQLQAIERMIASLTRYHRKRSQRRSSILDLPSL
jgi:four helix bundle protein